MRFPRSTIAALVAAAFLAGAPAALAQAPAPAAPTGGAAFTAAPAGGLDLAPGALRGHALQVAGTLADAAGGTVRVQALDGRTETWTTVGEAQADADGRFALDWRPHELGALSLRAVPGGGDSAQAAQAGADLPTGQTTVYRPGRATWYGPGFWGKQTACGVVLRRTTLGVAHRHLPCGTEVTLYHGGRSITVPVIDRGPYGGGASWDLTQATAEALGMTETSRIGWLRAADAAPSRSTS